MIAVSKNNEVNDIPVREAIRRLESEGYVQLNANYGPVVGDFSLDHLNQIFGLRLCWRVCGPSGLRCAERT